MSTTEEELRVARRLRDVVLGGQHTQLEQQCDHVYEVEKVVEDVAGDVAPASLEVKQEAEGVCYIAGALSCWRPDTASKNKIQARSNEDREGAVVDRFGRSLNRDQFNRSPRESDR